MSAALPEAIRWARVCAEASEGGSVRRLSPADVRLLCDVAERATRALDRIHAAMSVPFEWSADTPEAVAFVLTSLGYIFPSEEAAEAMEENPAAAAVILPPLRPEWGKV